MMMAARKGRAAARQDAAQDRRAAHESAYWHLTDVGILANVRFAPPEAAAAERSDFTRQYRLQGHPREHSAHQWWHELCMAELTGYSSSTKVTMLVTLVAILCNSQLCLEKVVTTSEQSGITMTACQVNAQIGIAAWLANGPYHEWRLKSYKCVLGNYVPKGDA